MKATCLLPSYGWKLAVSLCLVQYKQILHLYCLFIAKNTTFQCVTRPLNLQYSAIYAFVLSLAYWVLQNHLISFSPNYFPSKSNFPEVLSHVSLRSTVSFISAFCLHLESGSWCYLWCWVTWSTAVAVLWDEIILLALEQWSRPSMCIADSEFPLTVHYG